MEIAHKEISANERQEGNGTTIARTIQHCPSISTICFSSKNLISNIKHVGWKLDKRKQSIMRKKCV